ncbi:MAG: class I SAM-dependent methyltransferase [Steroidobacteraceae bacterium]
MTRPEFDRYAESYAELHRDNIRITGEEPDYFARYKVRHAARLAGTTLPVGRVLDFGCGTGNSTVFLPHYFPGCEIVGVDVSSACLDVARERTGDGVSFRSVDGDRIPFDDGYFGLVLVSCVLHHVPRAEHDNVLREIRRVLAPDGLLTVYEHNPWNPLTAHAVRTCKFDESAEMIAARPLKTAILRAGFRDAATHFIVFFPGFLRFLRWLEPLLAWLPLGAQYCVSARK